MPLTTTGAELVPDVLQTSKIQLQSTATDTLTIKSQSGTSILTIDTATPSITLNADTTIVGNAVFQNSTNVAIEDNLMQLASGNTATDLLDTGWFGTYNSGAGTKYWSTFRRAGTNDVCFYDNVTDVPNNTVNTAAATLMDLVANNITGTIVTSAQPYITQIGTLTSALNLGTNSITNVNDIAAVSASLSGSTANKLIYSNGSKALTSANVSSNLSFTGGTLDTVQGITTASSPSFTGLTVSGTTANTLLYGNGSKAISSAALGSNLTLTTGTLDTVQAIGTGASPQFSAIKLTTGASNNYVLKSDASGNASWSALSSLGVSSITGTANQVNASASTGAVTLSLPQSIATGSDVQFNKVSIGAAGTGKFDIQGSQTSGVSAYGALIRPSTTMTGNGTTYCQFFLGGTTTINGSGVNSTEMMQVSPICTATTTCNNLMGVHIYPASGSGTINNAYGLFVEHPSVGTNKYSAYLGGKTLVGTNTDDGSGSNLQVLNSFSIGANANTTASTGLLRFQSTGSVNYIQSGLAASGGSSAPLVFTAHTAANEWMRISSAGLLGIGTSSPNYGVHLSFGTSSNSSNKQFAMLIDSTVEAPTSPSWSTSAQLGINPKFNQASTKPMTNVCGMFIDQGLSDPSGALTNGYGLYVRQPLYGVNKYTAYFEGNTGFGNTAPAYPIDVTGNARVSGTLNVNQIQGTGSALTVAGTLQGTSSTNDIQSFRNITISGYVSCGYIGAAQWLGNCEMVGTLTPEVTGTREVGTSSRRYSGMNSLTATHKQINLDNNINTSSVTAQKGTTIYDSTDDQIKWYDGTRWLYKKPSSSVYYTQVISATGNAINNAGTAAVNGWSCSRDTGGTSVNVRSFGSASGTYIQSSSVLAGTYFLLAVGALPAGVYEIRYQLLCASDRGTVTLTETSTGATIRSNLDCYNNAGAGSGSVLTLTDQFLFTGSSMTLKWQASSKNASSSDYFIMLSNSVEVVRVG